MLVSTRLALLIGAHGILYGVAATAVQPTETPKVVVDEHGELEEIIVTATRRETALQDTALSMTALSQAKLESIGARDIVDYFEHVAGLNYTDDTFGGFRIESRGIASGTFVETRPLSAFYLDETPMMALASGSGASPQWGGTRPQAVDVARVEVLRGPQGTLFGASTMGGTVRMITNAPDPGRLYGSVEMGYSTTAHGGSNYKIDGFLNAPLIEDRLAVRLVGYLREDDGYIDNIARDIKDINDVSTTGGRLALLWNATSDLSITARAQRQERDSDGLNAADVAAGDYEQIRFAPERNDETWDLFTLEVDYELPWAGLKYLGSRLEREPSLALDITEFVNRILSIFNPTANDIRDSIDDTIHELRLTSNSDGRLSWVAGAYYQNQDRKWIQEWLSPGFDALTGGLAASFGYPDRLIHLETSGELRQRALYGEASYQLSPTWEATLGARLFEFDYSIDNTQDGFLNPPSTIQASSDESGITPKLGVAYRPSDHVLIFANAAEGFRPGGTNEFTDQNVENCAGTLETLNIPVPPARGYESDSLWNFELGTKTSWPDRGLEVNAAVYHVRWDDMQTTRTVDCGIDLINIIENVGKATTNGLEFEMSWSPTAVWEFGVGLAYTDARLDEDAPNLAGEDGERIPMVPEWAFNASAAAYFPLTARAEGFARAGYQYVDSTWSDFDAAIRRRTPSRQVLDLRFGARIENWQIELFADNVFDERRVLFHFNNTFLGEWHALMQPRTIGILARVSY